MKKKDKQTHMRKIGNFFFVNDTATTEIYTDLHTLSLHYALPICAAGGIGQERCAYFSAEGAAIAPNRGTNRKAANTDGSGSGALHGRAQAPRCRKDRKSTRLNSSH